ncbi:hypothetical protein [Streptomyces sp. NPDC047928]
MLADLPRLRHPNAAEREQTYRQSANEMERGETGQTEHLEHYG